MAVSLEEQVLAQRVVDETKSTARVDTGMLKRSIYYTVARGMVVFRQPHLPALQFHRTAKSLALSD